MRNNFFICILIVLHYFVPVWKLLVAVARQNFKWLKIIYISVL